MIKGIKQHIITRFAKEYIKKHLKIILFAILLMIGEAFGTSSTAYLAQPVIDKIFFSKDISQLWGLSGIILLAFAFKASCAYWKQVFLTLVETKIVSNLQQTLFRKIIRFDMRHFDRSSIGSVLNHFIADIQNIKQALATIILNVGRDIFTIIFLISIMFYQNWLMSIFCFIGLPIVFIPMSKISQKLRRFASLAKIESDVLTGHLNDSFTGIRIIKAYGGEDGETKVFDGITDKIAKLSFKAMKKGAMASPMMEMFAAIAVVITLIFGGLQVIHGEMTTGAFFSFLTSLVMLQRPAKSLGGTGYLLHNAIVALEKIYATLDSQNKIEYTSFGQKTPSFIDAKIEFKNVGFSYFDDSAEAPVAIKNLNLSINTGSQIALVGSSGGGKSTVVNLLLRFYDVSEGSVEINGHDIRNIQIDHLRKNITYVGQEAFIFEDTVRKNILYGLENITEEQLKYAISEAGADFIYKLQYGLETAVRQQGSLSGGQKQLISIVRAMLKNSPILILDEATSSLDNTTEREVKQALEKLVTGKTTIIIAHRLSTVVHCDQINVINDGKIVESGSHVELIEKQGFYYQLWSAQGV